MKYDDDKWAVSEMKGFTLIELMIVIAVTGIVLSVSAVKFDSYIKDDAVDKAAYKIKYDISYLQNMKMSDTRDYKILFDNTEKSYTCFRDDDDDDIVDAGEMLFDPVTKREMKYDFAIPAVRSGSVQNFRKIELESINIYDQSGASAMSSGKVILYVDKYGSLQVRTAGVYGDISSNTANTIVIKLDDYRRTLTLYPITTDMKIE